MHSFPSVDNFLLFLEPPAMSQMSMPSGTKLVEDGPGKCREHSNRRHGNQGYGSQWRRVRNAYNREHPRCEECDAPAREAHHRDHRGARGPRGFDWSTLEALCVPCHRKLTRARERQLRNARSVAGGV